MPERSPDRRHGTDQAPGSEFFPETDLLESPDLATQIGEMADGDVIADSELAQIDPDQVSTDDVVKKRLGLTFWLAGGWFALFALVAILAPFLPLQDYKAINRDCIRCPPSAEHWLGTDTLGRDILSRIIYGGRVSLVVGVASVALGLFFGGFIGLVAGHYKGRLEGLLMGAMDVMLAFPALLLALAIITFRQDRSMTNVVLAIGLIAIPPIARLFRAATLVYSQREFVTASRAIGARDARIIVREILPNVMLPVLSFSIIGIAVAIVAEGSLAFLGLSVPPPTPTWGGMINEGRTALQSDPFIVLIPCAAMFITVLSLNLAGDKVREYFDVKEGVL